MIQFTQKILEILKKRKSGFWEKEWQEWKLELTNQEKWDHWDGLELGKLLWWSCRAALLKNIIQFKLITNIQ